MRPVLLVPGIGNSGPTHWQSLWQEEHSDVGRVTQRDWDNPVCDGWVEALDQASIPMSAMANIGRGPLDIRLTPRQTVRLASGYWLASAAEKARTCRCW